MMVKIWLQKQTFQAGINYSTNLPELLKSALYINIYLYNCYKTSGKIKSHIMILSHHNWFYMNNKQCNKHQTNKLSKYITKHHDVHNNTRGKL